MDVKQFKELQEKVKEINDNAKKTEGAMQQLLEQLKDDHDLDSIEEAEEFLEIKKKALEDLKKKYDEKLEGFLERYADELDLD